MKKILSLVLCMLMVISAFSGCAAQQPGESTGATNPETTAPKLDHVLQVGYGRADATPRVSIPLGGSANSVVGGASTDRMSSSVKNPLYVTCVALTDETGNTILLYHLDLLFSFAGTLVNAKMAVAKATGVKGSQIVLASTHNHNAPDLFYYDRLQSINDYVDAMKDWMVQAAEDAMADRKPAQMYIASAELENMNFVRHYLMSDGSYVGANFGTTAGKTFVKHVVDPDRELQLVKFTREGAKDILLMNWQAHPHANVDARYSVASDVDETRQVVERELDCHFAFFLGAAGNVNSRSLMTEENTTSNYAQHGQKLGQCVVETATKFQKAETDTIRFMMQEKQVEGINPDEGARLVPMYAFSFGDLAFATVPYEMFTENGKAIKEGSPYKMTFISTCTNEGAYLAYIPSEYAFGYNSYEAQMSKVVPGTAEILEAEYIQFMKKLYEAG